MIFTLDIPSTPSGEFRLLLAKAGANNQVERSGDLPRKSRHLNLTLEAQGAVILWWRAALLCGLLPLVLGVAIFGVWYAIRAPWLVEAGLLNIRAGLLLVCVGLLCVLAYALRARAQHTPGWKGRATIAVLVMLANFPAAALLMVLADHIASAYVVVVENMSPWPVMDLAFQSDGDTYAFGAVPPKSSRELAFHFPQERELSYVLSLNGQPQKDSFDGYVAGWGNKATLHISEAGLVSIRHERF